MQNCRRCLSHPAAVVSGIGYCINHLAVGLATDYAPINDVIQQPGDSVVWQELVIRRSPKLQEQRSIARALGQRRWTSSRRAEHSPDVNTVRRLTSSPRLKPGDSGSPTPRVS